MLNAAALDVDAVGLGAIGVSVGGTVSKGGVGMDGMDVGAVSTLLEEGLDDPNMEGKSDSTCIPGAGASVGEIAVGTFDALTAVVGGATGAVDGAAPATLATL
jgi:hypothetical protein